MLLGSNELMSNMEESNIAGSISAISAEPDIVNYKSRIVIQFLNIALYLILFERISLFFYMLKHLKP